MDGGIPGRVMFLVYLVSAVNSVVRDERKRHTQAALCARRMMVRAKENEAVNEAAVQTQLAAVCTCVLEKTYVGWPWRVLLIQLGVQ